MKICPNCGVELDNSMNFCPLCGEPVMDKNNENIEYIRLRKQKQDEILRTPYQKLSSLQKRKLFWEISGIILISGIIITLIIDLIQEGSISWSRYSMMVSAVLFANISVFCFLLKKINLLIIGSLFSTSFLFILLDIFNHNIGWGIKLGIPLLFFVYLIVYTLLLLIRRTRERELNMITYSLVAAGLLCICIEGVISLYVDHVFVLHWSLVVIVCIVPVSSLLLYIQYRLKKGTDLKRFFHI